MSLPGAFDPEYVAARRVLLDAVEALTGHTDALVLVGAQAVYVHTGDADLAAAPFTTDADIAIDPTRLGPDPLLEQAMAGAGFEPEKNSVGAWRQPVEIAGLKRLVTVDFLVPESIGGSGRRGARIPPHAKHVARKARGLEATLVDKDRRRIAALEPSDVRRFDMWIGGPSGLLVAKAFKIAERIAAPNRLSDKDALDVYRLLRAVSTEHLIGRFHTLERSALSRDTARSGLAELRKLSGSPAAPGCEMAVRAIGPLADAATVRAALVALTQDLLRGL